MNSNYGKTGTTFNNFDFDLGLGTSRSSRPLNEQKNKSNSSSYTYMSNSSSSSSSFNQPKTTPSWQPGKPSWTHQPAPSQPSLTRTELGGPTSMVGDIFGKSWNSLAPKPLGPSAGLVGVVNKNTNLFGDLVSSALGQNKSNRNAPLKNAMPVKASSGSGPGSFLMGVMADSLPKSGNSPATNVGGGGSWGGFGGVGSSGGGYGSGGINNKSPNLGGPSLKSVGSGGGGIGVAMSSSKDPFGNLVGFGSKPAGGASLSSGGKPSSTTSDDFAFGDFQNAAKSSASAFSSGNGSAMGSSTGSFPGMDCFAPQKQIPVQSIGGDSFGVLFSSSSASSGNHAPASNGADGSQEFSGADDWGFDGEFGGEHDVGNTTELEGLPPPPAGVSAASAKMKGLENYKQGQYADAINWLSWAEVLLGKAGETAGVMEVLSCRASCYKEVGEYKKAVADCTKVLDHDGTIVAVLVQRALLYESLEKYRLGAEDLRTVMKLDPGNRVARSTIHPLNKMAD